MGTDSKIEWCDHTFNPWIGCQKVSPACDHCYAEAWDNRYGGGHWGPDAPRRLTSDANWRKPPKWNRDAEAEGKRAKVFSASLADVFDNRAPEGARERLWTLIRETPSLDWLLLTKRPGNIREMLPEDWGAGYHNVWLGTTIENRQRGMQGAYQLACVPAVVRFWSVEPLLEDLGDLTALCLRDTAMDGRPAVHWVITGGESGPGARPAHPDWFRSVRDQCVSACVAYFHKQHGEWAAYDQIGANGWSFTREVDGKRYGIIETGEDYDNRRIMFDGREFETRYPWIAMSGSNPCMVRVGKRRAGRLLDGRAWDQMPEPRHA